MAERATLVNSTLTATSAYYMQAMDLPTSVHNQIDRICRNFLWGSSDDKRRIHLISWDKVTDHKNNGGLGTKANKKLNTAYMSKLGWQVLNNNDSMWAKVLKEKYIHCNRYPANCSPIWKGISSCISTLEKGIRWIIMKGEKISLWEDDWTGLGPLKQIFHGPINKGEMDMKVMALIDQHGNWNFRHLNWEIPLFLKDIITAIPI